MAGVLTNIESLCGIEGIAGIESLQANSDGKVRVLDFRGAKRIELRPVNANTIPTCLTETRRMFLAQAKIDGDESDEEEGTTRPLVPSGKFREAKKKAVSHEVCKELVVRFLSVWPPLDNPQTEPRNLPVGFFGMPMPPGVAGLAESRGRQGGAPFDMSQIPFTAREEMRASASKAAANATDLEKQLLHAVVVNDLPNVIRAASLMAVAKGTAGSVDARNQHGESALSLASLCGFLSVAQQLLRCKATVDATNGGGCTPLHEACHQGFPAMVRLLVNNGADIECRSGVSTSGSHLTPLLIACKHNSYSVVRELVRPNYSGSCSTMEESEGLRLGHDVPSAMDALKLNQEVDEAIATSSKWLSGGTGHAPPRRRTAQLETCTLDGDSPFYLAAFHAGVESLHELHAVGANQYAAHRAGGVTALHNAVANGQTAVAEFLLSHGFRPDTATYNGQTALHVAALKDRGEIASMLVAAKADVNCAMETGTTPFHAAASAGHLDLAAFLYARGARKQCEGKCTKCRLQLKQAEKRLTKWKEQRQIERDHRRALRRREEERRQAEAELAAEEPVDFMQELRRVEAEINDRKQHQERQKREASAALSASTAAEDGEDDLEALGFVGFLSELRRVEAQLQSTGGGHGAGGGGGSGGVGGKGPKRRGKGKGGKSKGKKGGKKRR